MKAEVINKWLGAEKSWEEYFNKLGSTNQQLKNMMEEFNKEQKKREIMHAKGEMTQLEAMKVLVRNNDLACEIYIAGMQIGLSSNKGILPILNAEIKEIQKFLDGKPNKWE